MIPKIFLLLDCLTSGLLIATEWVLWSDGWTLASGRFVGLKHATRGLEMYPPWPEDLSFDICQGMFPLLGCTPHGHLIETWGTAVPKSGWRAFASHASNVGPTPV